MNVSKKLTQNYAIDLTVFGKYGSDELSILTVNIGGAITGHHTPRFFVFFAIFNFVIFDIMVYNINHEDEA